MAKLTVEDLKKIKERAQREDQFRSGEKHTKITVHLGTCGIASGGKKILDTVMQEIESAGANDVLVTTSGCIGICSREPLVTIETKGSEPIVYELLNPAKMQQIFRRHVLEGAVQTEFVMARGKEQER